MQEKDVYLFEIIEMGAYAKVTVIDPRTGAEASVNGPAGIGVPALKKLAVKKVQKIQQNKES